MSVASHIRPLLHYLRLDGLLRHPRLAPRVRFVTIYVKMLIGQLVLFVNEAFCINQLTVGPGQELLRTGMEISSKMSSKPRKSWIWKLMVKR